ncbi:hypothetical protein CVT26_014733 [Gymnopilus dilepis]|uniref:Uncharacterized protein n=1 Tax=Gymnopilus dilepis TaxID=231916 RepID=A0A409W3Q3_9AGAR|nr:hypothetical protein CVT26_014733 [Gymnopilus dilepis]
MEVVETDVRMDVDGKMDIDMSTDQPCSELQIASITFGSALDLLPRQTCSSALDAMDVDLLSPSTTAARPAGTISQESLEQAGVPTSLLVSQSQSHSQPRAPDGSQALPSPASSNSSPSPTLPPSGSTSESPEKWITGISASYECGTSSCSTSSGGATPEVITTPNSILADSADAVLPPLDDDTASSLAGVPTAARFVDAGNLEPDIGQDVEGHVVSPAVDKVKGKQRADSDEPGQGGEEEEEIDITKVYKNNFDFDWDKEADRFYNGEYDDELEENKDYDDEYDDDSDYWGSGEDGFTDDESESESGSGSGSGKNSKSKFKVLDEFGFDMLSFAKMLYESGEMEILQREAHRSASPSPSSASSSRSPSSSPPPPSRSPTPEPLDPDFPDLDDMDDVSIEEMNKHLKGLKVVKVQRIGENGEKISFDWTDSGDETEESEVVGVGMGAGVPRLVWTSPTPPQSPARQCSALPAVDTSAAAPATSTSAVCPPSTSTSTFSLSLKRPPPPFPPQQIPDTERLRVPPPQFTRGNRRVALERFLWERKEWLRRYYAVRVLWGDKKREERKVVGEVGSKKEGRVYRRLPRRVAGQRMVTRSMSRSPSPGPGAGELMNFEPSWMGESSRGPVTRSMTRSPTPGPGMGGREERKFTPASFAGFPSSKPKPRSKRKAEEVDGRAKAKVKTEEGTDADMDTETDLEADGPKTRSRSRSATRMGKAKEDVKKDLSRGRGRGRTPGPKIIGSAFSVKVEVDTDANGKPWEVWRGILTNAANFADSKPMRIRTRSRSRELERFGSHWDERSAMRRSARLSVGKKEKTRKGMRVRKEGMYMGGY